jgi:hypothetical protein
MGEFFVLFLFDKRARLWSNTFKLNWIYMLKYKSTILKQVVFLNKGEELYE